MKYIKIFAILLITSIFFGCNPEPFVAADVRTEISKNWQVAENDGTQMRTYESVITKDPAADTKVDITNFHQQKTVKATVFADKTITIPDQELTSTGVKLKNCTGIISSSMQKIDWTYTIDDPNDQPAYQVTATFTTGNPVKRKI